MPMFARKLQRSWSMLDSTHCSGQSRASTKPSTHAELARALAGTALRQRDFDAEPAYACGAKSYHDLA